MPGSHSRPEDRNHLKQAEPTSLPVGLNAVSPGRHPGFGKTAAWSLVGCLAIVCIAVIVFAWPISDGRTAKSTPMPSEAAPARISVAAVEKAPVTIQAIPAIAAAGTDKLAEQSAVQPQIMAKPAEPAVSLPSEMAQRMQAFERRLISLEQAIEQARSDQARLTRESAELMGNLNRAQEKLIQRIEELAGEIKAAEEKAAQYQLTAAEQLRGNQEQLAKIGEQLKASQQQVDPKVGAQQRGRRLASPQPQLSNAPAALSNAPAARKPAPKPPSAQARVSPPQSLSPSQAR
jgi:hypothetical protein